MSDRCRSCRAEVSWAETVPGGRAMPLDKAEEMLALAEEQAEREQRTREWVAKGKTVEDLLAEFGRI